MGFVPLQSLARRRHKGPNVRLSLERWTDLIQEGAALGCKNCQFILWIGAEGGLGEVNSLLLLYSANCEMWAFRAFFHFTYDPLS